MSVRSFRRFSLGVLAYNLFVVAWGAYVRASGSGAGCGSHWPLCNGQVIPRTGRIATLIEFTHRATSGVALISVVALVIFAFLSHPRGSIVRKGAAAALFFMLTEAAVGAGLVLFELVAENKSMARAMFMSVHLINTFFLLASLALTVVWSFGIAAPRLRRQGVVGAVLAAAATGLLLLGVSGAITALGDTLFPASSLAEGFHRDFSATAHIFIRLRLWHPLIALLMGAFVTAAAVMIAAVRPIPAVKRASAVLTILFLVQLGLGAVNVVLLAPIAIQLLHLLVADCVWISLIGLAAVALADAPQTAPGVEAAPELSPAIQ